jgi:hypothetical protein
MDTLDQAAGAVAYTRDGDTYFAAHGFEISSA